MEGRPHGGLHVFRSTNPNQALLFNEPSYAPLIDALVASFRGKGQIVVEQVETFVQDDTAYVRKHMGEVLLQLETGGNLSVAPTKTDGTNRRAKSFPNDAQVTFL